MRPFGPYNTSTEGRKGVFSNYPPREYYTEPDLFNNSNSDKAMCTEQHSHTPYTLLHTRSNGIFHYNVHYTVHKGGAEKISLYGSTYRNTFYDERC